jgi:hypothetical protein
MLITQITKVVPQSGQENLINQIKWVLLGSNLIIGDFMDHMYMVMEALHPDLNFGEAMKKVDGYRNQVVAAGVATKDGSMLSWESTGFGMVTPRHLQDELSADVRDIIVDEPNWRQHGPSASY